MFADREVLDYGASWGTSALALLQLGARSVVGVDIDAGRIEQACSLLAGRPVQFLLVVDTRHLPFGNGAFTSVLANAVLEHIPRPRHLHLRELWRVVAPGGYLIVNETPNALYPVDKHTTGLWGNHWLPRNAARRRAVRRGRFDASRADWDSSGWRGLYYWELKRELPASTLVPEQERWRRRPLTALGLPGSLFDPYPTWVFRKD